MNAFRCSTALCTIGVAVLTVFCAGSAAAQLTPADTVLGSHLIGTYDNNQKAYLSTVIQVVNPTGGSVKILAFFLDDKENLLKCVMKTLTPDDLEQIDVRTLGLGAKVGVVKIVSVGPDASTAGKGIVGYKRTFYKANLVSETILHSVPAEAGVKMIARYRGSCGK